MLISELGVELLEILAIIVVEWVIFANFLIGATIQDGGKRERAIFDVTLNSNSNKKKSNKK